jgi:tetratricopeptide (TPR) repeat protein
VAWFNGLVNAQNGHLDEAIADFEKILDPENQVREKKYDFRRDYVVIDELGTALFRRAQQEADDSPERERFLRRAVEQYQATLRINPEDLAAHYGLAQCYTLLGGGLPAAVKTIDATREALTAAARTFAAVTTPRAERLQTAADLKEALARYNALPSRPTQPKLPALIAMIAECRRVYEQSDDAVLRAATAHLLGELHRQAHAIYKPDDIAEGRTKALYRAAHPAADKAAEAVVIYPLH